jgi:hypothetical protein
MTAKRRPARGVRYRLTEADKSVLTKIVLVGSLMLGTALVLVHTLMAGLVSGGSGWLNALRTGAGLLVFWLFVTACVRTMERLRPGVSFLWLLATGLGTAALGAIVFLVGIRLLAWLWPEVTSLPSYALIFFYTAAGLLASLISLIRLRVANDKTGNILEIGLAVLAIALFFYLVK